MVTDASSFFFVAFAGMRLIERIGGIWALWNNSPQIVSVGDPANLDRPTSLQVVRTSCTFASSCGCVVVGFDFSSIDNSLNSQCFVDFAGFKCMDLQSLFDPSTFDLTAQQFRPG